MDPFPTIPEVVVDRPADAPQADAPQADAPQADAPQALPDDAAMIAVMRRYRSAKAEQERRRRRADEYLRQVKEQIEADLAAGDEHLEKLRSSMLAFVTHHNAGRKFSVPGLGTATTTTRTRVRIADEERFLAALPEDQREALFDRKLSGPRARAAAKTAFEEDGEQLPGVEASRVTSLSVRLSDDRPTTGPPETPLEHGGDDARRRRPL